MTSRFPPFWILIAGMVCVFAMLAAMPCHAQSADPLQVLEKQKKDLLLRQTIELGRALTEQQRAAMAKGDMDSSLVLKGRLEAAMEAYQTLQKGDSPERAAATDPVVEFISKASGRTWDLTNTTNVKHVHFDGKNLKSMDAAGNPGITYPTKIIWPGLMRAETGEKSFSYYLFDIKLDRIIILKTSQEFSGTLIEN